MVAPELWYRLGSAQEQDILLEMKAQHAGIVVPAHVFAYGRTWVTQFLRKIRKPFVIDPMTYMLAFPREQITGDSGLKKSWETLLRLYDAEELGPVRRRPIRAADLLSKDGRPTEILKAFVRQTVELQTTILVRGSPSQESLEKYRKILGEESPEPELKPHAVLAPYFHFGDTNDPWWVVNLALVREAKRLAAGTPTYAVVSTDVSTAAGMDWDVAIPSLGPIDAVLLWISDFSELDADYDELRAVLRAVRRLSSHGRVFRLYGGYFSLSLATVGLTGLISGICYGESKAVMSKTTGGGMPQRYYVVENKVKYVMPEVRSLYSDVPGRLCRCRVCLRVRKRAGISETVRPTVRSVAAFFDQVDDAASKRHFLEVRSEEARAVARREPHEVGAALWRASKEARDSKLPGHGMSIGHLDRWGTVLQEV